MTTMTIHIMRLDAINPDDTKTCATEIKRLIRIWKEGISGYDKRIIKLFSCSLYFWSPELKLTGRRHEILKTIQPIAGGVYTLHLGR